MRQVKTCRTKPAAGNVLTNWSVPASTVVSKSNFTRKPGCPIAETTASKPSGGQCKKCWIKPGGSRLLRNRVGMKICFRNVSSIESTPPYGLKRNAPPEQRCHLFDDPESRRNNCRRHNLFRHCSTSYIVRYRAGRRTAHQYFMLT